MASIKFRIKGSKDPSTIYIRYRDKTSDAEVPSGISINPEFWNNKSGWFRNKAAFTELLNYERELNQLKAYVLDCRFRQLKSSHPLNSNWLRQAVNTYWNKESSEKTFIEYMEEYKNSLKSKVSNGKKGVSEGTIKNYNTTIQRLKKYENKLNCKLFIQDLNLQFHKDYLEFASNELGLSINSIGKDFKQIKTVCFQLRDEGINIPIQVLSKKFNSPSEKSIFTTLTERDLEVLMEYKGIDRLENAREWLILGCYTGMRVGDLFSLTTENIHALQNGVKVIQHTQSKTLKKVTVPIHPYVERIIERNNGLPRPISNAKFNKYIKELCKACGISDLVKGTRQNPKTHKKETGYFEKWELIRSHTCRRSFATIHFNKLPNKVIMAVTGHSTERMLLTYIGKTETDHLNQYISLWKEQIK